MKKIKLFSLLAVSLVVLGACSSNSQKVTKPASQKEETTKKVDNKKEKAEKDAGVLLDAIFSTDDVKFKKVYGETYEDWSDEVIAVQTSAKIKEDGLSPAADYSVQWSNDFPVETPEETISGVLEVRRSLYQKIGDYEIKEVKVDDSGDSATVTFSSKKLHSKGLASATRDVLTTLIGGIDNLAEYNKAGSTETVKRYQTLLSYWIFRHLYRNDFAIYSNVDPNLAHVPLTAGEFETEIKLTKDKEGNWLISQDDYKTLLSELLDNTEGYDTIDRSGISTYKSKSGSVDDSVSKTKDKSSI